MAVIQHLSKTELNTDGGELTEYETERTYVAIRTQVEDDPYQTVQIDIGLKNADGIIKATERLKMTQHSVMDLLRALHEAEF